jgi:hypothetical protein
MRPERGTGDHARSRVYTNSLQMKLFDDESDDRL